MQTKVGEKMPPDFWGKVVHVTERYLWPMLLPIIYVTWILDFIEAADKTEPNVWVPGLVAAVLFVFATWITVRSHNEQAYHLKRARERLDENYVDNNRVDFETRADRLRLEARLVREPVGTIYETQGGLIAIKVPGYGDEEPTWNLYKNETQDKYPGHTSQPGMWQRAGFDEDLLIEEGLKRRVLYGSGKVGWYKEAEDA